LGAIVDLGLAVVAIASAAWAFWSMPADVPPQAVWELTTIASASSAEQTLQINEANQLVLGGSPLAGESALAERLAGAAPQMVTLIAHDGALAQTVLSVTECLRRCGVQEVQIVMR
jgi:biopolymer transport protein ExbD